MDNNITWKDIFKSLFLKDLIYILPLILVKLVFRYWVAPKFLITTSYKDVAIYIEIITTIGIVLIMIIEWMRKKDDTEIKNFLQSEIEKDKGKSFSMADRRFSTSFKLMILYLLRGIYYSSIIWLVFYGLY
jgi:hypothetical protein